MTNLSRRKFIFTASATATASILAHGCSAGSNTASTGGNSPSAAPAANVSTVANAPKVEVTKAKLGFIALTDAAPLIIAKEKGFFAK